MSRITSHRGWIGLATAVLVSAATTPLAAQRTLASNTPLAPTNVVVAGSKLGVTVTWTGVPTQAMYRVLRSVDLANRGVDLTVPITTTSYLDRSAEPGASYYYQIIAVYADQTEGLGAAILFTPAPATQQDPKVGAVPLSGLTLPLAEPILPPNGTAASAPVTLVMATVATLCNPIELPGAGPDRFAGVVNSEPVMGASWPEVAGAVAYVVERSVWGSNAWKAVASTCGGPSPLRSKAYDYFTPSKWIEFIDYSGGIVPQTRYVYKVKAIGARGETGWSFTVWDAPASASPVWYGGPTITGNTVDHWWNFTLPRDAHHTRVPDQYVLATEYGWSETRTMPLGTTCPCKWTITGVPKGPHTLTVTAQWIDRLVIQPYYVYASSSGSTTILVP